MRKLRGWLIRNGNWVVVSGLIFILFGGHYIQDDILLAFYLLHVFACGIIFGLRWRSVL